MDQPTNSDRESGGMPRWVVMLLIGLVIAVLLVVLMMFVGGGGHQIPDHGAVDSAGERSFVAAASD